MDRAEAHAADLNACLKITEFLFRKQSSDEFLAVVLEVAIRRLRADRGAIFLVDPHHETLSGFVMTGVERPSDMAFPLGQGIVGHVVRTGEILNIRDAYQDERFFTGIDEKTGYRTRAILCMPIRGCENSPDTLNGIYGAIELLNPMDRDAFSAEDEQTLRTLMAFAGVRLSEYSVIRELIRKQELLSTQIASYRDDSNSALARIIGHSAALERLRHTILTVAPFDSNVLIHGESGTGKELVAQCLHALSPRTGQPFVALNCGAIPEPLLEAELFGIEQGVATGVARRAGKIEQASGGTLFLDEIGEMPQAMQVRLLRVLQEREVVRVGGNKAIPVDIRVLGATHRSVQGADAAKWFREDFLYRVNVLLVEVPTLRERLDDVPLLAAHFLEALNRRYDRKPWRSFSADAVLALQRHLWPGNVRQLQNEVEKMYVLCPSPEGVIDVRQVQERLAPSVVPAAPGDTPRTEVRDDVDLTRGVLSLRIADVPLAEVIGRAERMLVEACLADCGGNKSRAAERLGISREGLRKMLARWQAEEPRRSA